MNWRLSRSITWKREFRWRTSFFPTELLFRWNNRVCVRYPSPLQLFAYFSVSASAERAAAPLSLAGDKYYERSLNGRRMLFNYPFESAWLDSGVEWMLPNLNAIWTRFSHWSQCTLRRKHASSSIFLLHRVYASTSIRFSKKEEEGKEKEERRAEKFQTFHSAILLILARSDARHRSLGRESTRDIDAI